MAFTVPTFNLSVNLWRFATAVGSPPDLTFMANLSFTRSRPPIIAVQISGKLFFYECTDLLCPKLTDIRGHTRATGQDRVEVPAGSGRFYAVQRVEDVAKGFANEYRCAVLLQMDAQAISFAGNPPSWGSLLWPEPTP